jgi:hypothetical protein
MIIIVIITIIVFFFSLCQQGTSLSLWGPLGRIEAPLAVVLLRSSLSVKAAYFPRSAKITMEVIYLLLRALYGKS